MSYSSFKKNRRRFGFKILVLVLIYLQVLVNVSEHQIEPFVNACTKCLFVLKHCHFGFYVRVVNFDVLHHQYSTWCVFPASKSISSCSEISQTRKIACLLIESKPRRLTGHINPTNYVSESSSRLKLQRLGQTCSYFVPVKHNDERELGIALQEKCNTHLINHSIAQ